ncbi:hypothetical protein [Clostridium sp. FP1]|uniref:hypothetical protein n=1 Tax=Clostridium sp. FP1 TaxID=2724076 RepID=UPI0013E9672F|nr:hypothetical protein [Clostridium sp. FP1]MBZ9633171.1 hypothetical protein [Clostridium sp. FP1]
MKKILKILCLSLSLVFVFAFGGNQKASAYETHCSVNGQYHRPTGTLRDNHLVKLMLNKKIVNAYLKTCACGEQVIATDAGCYCYPSDSQFLNYGIPYTPASFSYYLPNHTYPGNPLYWIGI